MNGPGLLTGALVAACGVAWRWARAGTARAAVARRLDAATATADARPGAGAAPTDGSTGGLPRPPAWAVRALAIAAIDVDAHLAWWGWLCALVGAAGAGLVAGGAALGALAPAAVVIATAAVLRSRHGHEDARVERALPLALEAMARGLRSGASLRQAIVEAAGVCPRPLREELERVTTAAAHGVPLVHALEELAARRPLPGVRLAIAALCLGAETGGAQARAVDGVAATLRDRLAVAAEVRALSSQTRASAAVIALAPVAFCAFASTTDPRTARFLFRTPLGLAFVAAGLALDGVSAVWMRRLSRVTV